MGNEPYFENRLTASLVSSSVLLTFSTFEDGSNLLAISFPINFLLNSLLLDYILVCLNIFVSFYLSLFINLLYYMAKCLIFQQCSL